MGARARPEQSGGGRGRAEGGGRHGGEWRERRGGREGEGVEEGKDEGENTDMSMEETSTYLCVCLKRDLQMGCIGENSTFKAVSKRDL